MGDMRVLRPQSGPQEMFLSSPADIVIYGGAAGGGKTYGLLLSALRYKNVPGFGCTIFRRNYNQIFSEGGLWDEARDMYQGVRGAGQNLSRSRWVFRDRRGRITSKVTFAHIERDDNLSNWQGAQICEIGFDELTHFSEKAFFYMLSVSIQTPIFSVGIGLASIVPSVLIINTKLWFAYPMSYPFFVITSEYGKLATNIDTAQIELIPWLPVAIFITILCLGISCFRFGQAERR